mmetsp:Transcript_46826/g.134898  ORF Transcript_46826/g.134898 Transcript_46826/m.134898 type:complete len:204 (+) Transcript_46826:407-1018(+)
MPLPPQVAHATALDVTVRHGVLPVVRCAHEPAELKAGTCEVEPQAQVEGHVGVVGVHVQAQVFSSSISYDEAVVPVPSAPRAPEEQLAQGLQHPLQLIDKWFEADLVEDDAVSVHAVRPPRGQPALVEVEDLLDQHIAERGRHELKGEDFAFEVLRQDRAPTLRRVLLHRLQEAGVKPLGPPPPRRLEQHGVPDLGRVLIDGR